MLEAEKMRMAFPSKVTWSIDDIKGSFEGQRPTAWTYVSSCHMRPRAASDNDRRRGRDGVKSEGGEEQQRERRHRRHRRRQILALGLFFFVLWGVFWSCFIFIPRFFLFKLIFYFYAFLYYFSFFLFNICIFIYFSFWLGFQFFCFIFILQGKIKINNFL